jgi:O-antigen ligase
MRDIFPLRDSPANKISYYHLLLLMASLPFDRFYSHLILISYAIHTIIYLDGKRVKAAFNLQTFILQSVFYVTVIATVYTKNTGQAFTEWGEQLTIFIFPLIFCLNKLDLKKYREPLLLGFALVCAATVMYLYVDAWKTIRHYQLPLSQLFSSSFTNHNFSEPIGMHATFFSLQLVIALVYLLSLLFKPGLLYHKLLYSCCSAVLLAGLIQLGSKSIFVVIIIVLNIALPLFLIERPKRLKYVLISVSLTVLVTAGILKSGTFKDRYVVELRQDLSMPKAGETIDGRLGRWNVAWGLIKKSPVIGHGAGSEIGLLQDGFFKNKLYNSYLNRLNAHNQYLSFLIKSGLIGLIVYVGTLAFGFKMAWREKDLVFFTFMLLVAIVSCSENVLDVDKGIFYYAFFFSFFVYRNDARITYSSIKG